MSGEVEGANDSQPPDLTSSIYQAGPGSNIFQFESGGGFRAVDEKEQSRAEMGMVVCLVLVVFNLHGDN